MKSILDEDPHSDQQLKRANFNKLHVGSASRDACCILSICYCNTT